MLSSWDFDQTFVSGLKSDPETAEEVLEHHRGFDRWKTWRLRSKAHSGSGDARVVKYTLCVFFFFLPVVCHPHVFDLQADEARKYGARVYCVGIKDFDEQQVRGLTS